MKFLGKWLELKKYQPKWGNPITEEYTWNAVTDKWILAQKLWIPKTQFTYQMIPKKKEGEGPGPGKAWSSIVGDYQDREVGGVDWRMGRGKRAYGTYSEGEPGKGKSFRM